jgi:hypothetical protein
METPQHDTPQEETARYESPKLSDYGTLVDLTAAAGNLLHSDVPFGQPDTAYPS